MDGHGVLLNAGRAALHDTTGKHDGILSEKKRIRKRRRGGEREQAAYVGMARQPVVSEAEADGPEQVGPQDHEKEREQAFPALQALARRFGDRRGKRGIIRGKMRVFRSRQQFEAGDAPRFGYRGGGIERGRA